MCNLAPLFEAPRPNLPSNPLFEGIEEDYMPEMGGYHKKLDSKIMFYKEYF